MKTLVKQHMTSPSCNDYNTLSCFKISFSLKKNLNSYMAMLHVFVLGCNLGSYYSILIVACSYFFSFF